MSKQTLPTPDEALQTLKDWAQIKAGFGEADDARLLAAVSVAKAYEALREAVKRAEERIQWLQEHQKEVGTHVAKAKGQAYGVGLRILREEFGLEEGDQ